jgi:hypothetical protein
MNKYNKIFYSKSFFYKLKDFFYLYFISFFYIIFQNLYIYLNIKKLYNKSDDTSFDYAKGLVIKIFKKNFIIKNIYIQNIYFFFKYFYFFFFRLKSYISKIIKIIMFYFNVKRSIIINTRYRKKRKENENFLYGLEDDPDKEYSLELHYLLIYSEMSTEYTFEEDPLKYFLGFDFIQRILFFLVNYLKSFNFKRFFFFFYNIFFDLYFFFIILFKNYFSVNHIEHIICFYIILIMFFILFLIYFFVILFFWII